MLRPLLHEADRLAHAARRALPVPHPDAARRHGRGRRRSPIPTSASRGVTSRSPARRLHQRLVAGRGRVCVELGVRQGGNNSVVECDLAKVEVAGSNPVSRSILGTLKGSLAARLPFRPSARMRRLRRRTRERLGTSSLRVAGRVMQVEPTVQFDRMLGC
jgi:hypothetical protein